MRKLYLLFLAIACLVSVGRAQDQPSPVACEVDWAYLQEQVDQLQRERLQFRNEPVPDNGQIVYIPLRVHWVRNDDGSLSKNNPETFKVALLRANAELSAINVQFVLDGPIHFIDNAAYLRMDRGTQLFKDFFSVKQAGVANLFMVDGWNTGAAGYGGVGGIELANASMPTLVHEIGHFLTLPHTFARPNGQIEAVSRDLNNGGNCDVAGDRICDTPADPHGLKPEQYLGEALRKEGCTMVSNTRDLNGDLYTPPFSNYMSYYFNCGYHFTPQQYERMRGAALQFHARYDRLSEGEVGAPTQIQQDVENGTDILTYSSAEGGDRVQVEYTLDQGATWTVMNSWQPEAGKIYLSDLPTGEMVGLRLRHLNSYAYSDVFPFTSTRTVYCMPPFQLASGQTGIGTFSLLQTPLKRDANALENYGIYSFDEPVRLFPGGTYAFNLRPILFGNSSFLGTFKIWLDENRDGDFDDPGEVKFFSVENNFNIRDSITLSLEAEPGPTRIRVRRFNNGDFTRTVTGCQNAFGDETEDYLVTIVEESSITLDTAYYDPGMESARLFWTDTSSGYGFVVERSVDGLAFEQIATLDAGQPLTYSDPQVQPNTQYSYRVRKQNGAVYSNQRDVVTGPIDRLYCFAENGSPCAVGFHLREIGVPELGYQYTFTAADCDDQTGYSDRTDELDPLQLQAGAAYDLFVLNSRDDANASLFIDFNQDGVFSEDESVLQARKEGSLLETRLAVPADAMTGTTAMRYRMFFNGGNDPCRLASYGETVDFAVEIRGGTQPQVDDLLAVGITTSVIDLSWTPTEALREADDPADPTQLALEISSDGVTFSSLDQVPVSAEGYRVTGLEPATRYFFRAVTLGALPSEPLNRWASTLSPSGFTPEVVLSSTEGPYTNDHFRVDIIWNQEMDGFTAGDLEVTNATLSNFQNGSTDYSVRLNPLTDGEVTLRVPADIAENEAGLPNVASELFSIIYDSERPGFRLVDLPNDVLNEAPVVLLETSEPLNLQPSLIVTGNAQIGDITYDASAGHYAIEVEPLGEGPVSLQLFGNAIRDLAGNPAVSDASLAFTYDITDPVLTLSSSSPATLDGAFPLTVEASEPVTGLTEDDFRITNGFMLDFAGADERYTATVVPAGSGDVIIELPNGAAADLAGNPSTTAGSLQRSANLVSPTVQLSSPAPMMTNQPFEVVATLNQETSNFFSEDLVLENGTVSNFRGTGTSYSFLVTPTANGPVSVRVPEGVFSNAIFQANEPSNVLERTFDNQAPIPSLVYQVLTDVLMVTISVSEAYEGLTEEDVNLVRGTISDFSLVDDEIAMVVELDANQDAEFYIPSGTFTDLAGNHNVASNRVIYENGDDIRPTVTLFTEGPYRVNGPFDLRISLSEDVQFFNREDISVTNGTVISLTGEYTNYQLTIQPDPLPEGVDERIVSVRVPDNVIQDQFFNFNLASNVITKAYDPTPPEIDLSSPDPDTVSGEFVVIVSVSESLREVEAENFTVTNGSIVDIEQPNPKELVYELTVRPEAEGDVTVSAPAGQLVDDAGNGHAEPSTIRRYNDITPPLILITTSQPDTVDADIHLLIIMTEAAASFRPEMISISNGGRVTSFEPEPLGNAYFVTISGMYGGEVEIVVPEGQFVDGVGNPNARSNTLVMFFQEVLLPVHWVFFDAAVVRHSKKVKLRWHTASELNNDHFEVQRSLDADDWQAIGEVDGAGTTNEPQRYTFTDEEARANLINYYRIAQVDHDGRRSYSDIQAVRVGEVREVAIRVYPNPTTDLLRVQVEGRPLESLRLVDGAGREVVPPVTVLDGQRAELSLGGLSAGVYYLLVNGEARPVVKE